jgi:hypothetical protein
MDLVSGKLLLRTSKTAQVAEGGLEGQFFTRPCTTNQMIHIELFPLFFLQCEHVSTLSLERLNELLVRKHIITQERFQFFSLSCRDKRGNWQCQLSTLPAMNDGQQ